MEYFDTIKRHDYEQISIIQNRSELFAIDVFMIRRGAAVGGTRFMKYRNEKRPSVMPETFERDDLQKRCGRSGLRWR